MGDKGNLALCLPTIPGGGWLDKQIPTLRQEHSKFSLGLETKEVTYSAAGAREGTGMLEKACGPSDLHNGLPFLGEK